MSYRLQCDGVFTLDHPLTVEHKHSIEMFVRERHEGTGYPDYPYCQWVPTDDGTGIEYTEDEHNGYYCTEWLVYLIEEFLAPWGYVLNGRVEWAGEEPEDLGVIVVRDNVAREAQAIITYSDPFAE